MLRQNGFTLIELIIVIVILGILSVVAAPRFIDISSDARVAKIKQLNSAIKSTALLIRSKCMVSSDCNISSRGSSAVWDGISYRLTYGWPDAGDELGNRQIDAMIEYDGFAASLVDGRNTRFTLQGAPDPTNCYVNYTDAYLSSDRMYNLVQETSGC